MLKTPHAISGHDMSATPTKLALTYVLGSPAGLVAAAKRNELTKLHEFWRSHWSRYFSETGTPEAGWEKHFEQQDIVVGLKLEDEFIACHLYTLYDLNLSATAESDYFSYLKSSSISTLKSRDVTRLMSMEYLGVSQKHSRNSENLSLGKLMVTLATFVGEDSNADAVFGTPITTTSTPKMMANIGAITLEEKIEKYGYDLCLQYVPTHPRTASLDRTVEQRAGELWQSREILTELPGFKRRQIAA